MKSSKAILNISAIFSGLCFCLNVQALVVLHTGTCTYDDSGERKFVWCTSDDRKVTPYTSFGATQNIQTENILDEVPALLSAYGKFEDQAAWHILKRDNVWKLEISSVDWSKVEQSINMTRCVSNPPISVEEESVTRKTCKQWLAHKLGVN